MKLDIRTIRLIAVGASIAANCQPCLEINSTKALENGADEQEIIEAIEIGKMVRTGAATKMDRFVSNWSNFVSPSPGTNSQCDCNSSIERVTGGRNG